MILNFLNFSTLSQFFIVKLMYFTVFLNEDDDDDDEVPVTVRMRTTTNQSRVGVEDPQKYCSARGLG